MLNSKQRKKLTKNNWQFIHFGTVIGDRWSKLGAYHFVTREHGQMKKETPIQTTQW